MQLSSPPRGSMAASSAAETMMTPTRPGPPVPGSSMQSPAAVMSTPLGAQVTVTSPSGGEVVPATPEEPPKARPPPAAKKELRCERFSARRSRLFLAPSPSSRPIAAIPSQLQTGRNGPLTDFPVPPPHPTPTAALCTTPTPPERSSCAPPPRRRRLPRETSPTPRESLWWLTPTSQRNSDRTSARACVGCTARSTAYPPIERPRARAHERECLWLSSRGRHGSREIPSVPRARLDDAAPRSSWLPHCEARSVGMPRVARRVVGCRGEQVAWRHPRAGGSG